MLAAPAAARLYMRSFVWRSKKPAVKEERHREVIRSALLPILGTSLGLWNGQQSALTSGVRQEHVYTHLSSL